MQTFSDRVQINLSPSTIQEKWKTPLFKIIQRLDQTTHETEEWRHIGAIIGTLIVFYKPCILKSRPGTSELIIKMQFDGEISEPSDMFPSSRAKKQLTNKEWCSRELGNTVIKQWYRAVMVHWRILWSRYKFHRQGWSSHPYLAPSAKCTKHSLSFFRQSL